MFLPCWAV
uniref:Uncharacterized protein n=1 Tax=Arundo donax TaxID=35708 RepID=A0A0A9H904_ARUDO